jgi:chromosome segregation ATPase
MTDEAELFKRRLDYIESALAELRDEIDRRNEATQGLIDRQRDIVAEKISAISGAVKELQLMIYGESKYQLVGLSAKIEAVNGSLATMQAEREALRNQIKGMRLALTVIGLAGPVLGPIVLKVLGELFS